MAIEVVAKSFALWVVILLLAVANGMLREALLIPKLGALPGLVLSGLLLSLAILAAAYLSLPWLPVRNAGGLLLVGLGWLVLTLIFEFSFGLIRGKAMPEILEAYTFKGGNLWSVVLAVTFAAPWLGAKLRAWP